MLAIGMAVRNNAVTRPRRAAGNSLGQIEQDAGDESRLATPGRKRMM